MKRVYFALILSLAMICMNSVFAIAETGNYTAGRNSYTDSITDGAQTVIIYKGGQNDAITADNIYYMNQAVSESGFSNLEMMMKLDAPAGEYTLVTGTDGKMTTFTISQAQSVIVGSEELDFLGVGEKDSTYSVAYVANTKSSLTEDSKIHMLYGEKLYTTNLYGEHSIINWIFDPVFYTDVQGEQRSIFAIQINGVSGDYVSVGEDGSVTPKFKLYLEE